MMWSDVRLFVRVLFLSSQLVVNFLVFYLITLFFGFSLFLLLASFFWLVYSFIDVFEREFRLQRFERLQEKMESEQE